MARNGKIARLPRDIRETLNRRLEDGEPGGALLVWLNELPVTRQVLARHFAGGEISKQNLSEWRQGGFKEWQARQETLEQTRELAAEAEDITATTGGKLADHLATVLAARYAAALAGWDGEINERFSRKLRTLRGLCQDIVELRRGDHSGARLQLERERLTEQREKTEEEVVEHFERWVKNADVRDWICQGWASPEERERRLREIFGITPQAAEEAAPSGPEPAVDRPGQSESNQIKPNEYLGGEI